MTKHNPDELQQPEWLNKEFLQDILRKRENDKNLKLTSLNFQPGTGKNDHYASVIYRAKVNYKLSNNSEQHKSLIIKVGAELPGQKKELLDQYKHFETEIRMYAEALPKIESVLRKFGDETKLCANAIYHSLAPHKCIIFEDLSVEGYTMIENRHCTLEEVKAALQKLSKLHAVSFKLAKEGNEEITEFSDGILSKNVAKAGETVDFGWDAATNVVSHFSKVLEKHENLKIFLPQLQKVGEKLTLSVLNCFNGYKNGARDGIMVLCHGDFHLKNMLIKYTKENLNDIMLLDYQMSFFGSAAAVIYAIIMLFSPEMRLKHPDELIYHYFSQFQKTLKLLKYEGHIPTMLEFQNELSKLIHWELFLTISFLVFNYEFVDPDGDLGKSIEDNDYRDRLWSRPEIVNELEILLKQLLYRGAFEN